MSMSKLVFNKEGTFKIVQFTDIHLKDGIEPDKDVRTLALMERIVETEKPDLIVFTGDLISSDDVDDQKTTFRRAIQCATNSDIPFAVIYGNHDSEKGVTRMDLQNILSEFDNCISETGPAHIHGVGNYTVTVQHSTEDQAAAVLYFFDSGEYAPDSIGGYAWIHPDQIHWYADQSRQVTGKNEGPLPGLAFLHIPLPEYDAVWQFGTMAGRKGEEVCCPKINSGLFAAFLEAGDVMGVFAGHDHDNDYVGVLHGISLVYGRVTGYNTYGELQRGARVITLHEGKREFQSWIRSENDSIV
ncbi:metallophosphoesterase family protein [Cohnella abietis]|uniref:Metallophosphatase n=1 Tax=Cohnella abietis TaxID=2507935 RepID=A0A3T1CYK0_9BACL|nr:metallophosphoesterase family protein [Cohnella abietis]BBI30849.1 metallophosphatase [Cohnella abietis]